MLISIDKIKVSDRIRKDFGDIPELANDIEENGLINPPVVTPENELIAGERRVRALKYLGYEQIEVRVMSVKDALHQLKLEISENENRKDFSFSEKMQWADKLKDEYGKIAEKNSTSGKHLPEVIGRVRDKVSQDIDMGSGEQFRKAEYIYQNADEEMIRKLDEKKLSINKAYLELKQEKESLENQLETERERHTQDIQRAKKNEAEAKDKEIDKIKKSLEKKEEQLENIQEREELLTEQLQEYKEQSQEYKNLQTQIDNLTKEKDSISRQIGSALTLSTLVVDIERMLKNQLAPIKYSRALLDTSDSPVVIKNVTDILNCVETWCNEMRRYVVNKNDFINIESEEI